MVTALLLNTLLSALNPVERQNVEFLGFSPDETRSAWRIEYRRRAEHTTDRFALIQVSGPHGQARFRTPDWVRADAAGNKLAVKASDFASANPEWGAAADFSAWRALEQRIGFRQRRVHLDNPTLRLARDEDGQLEMTAEQLQINVTAAAGQPMGFTPVVRLVDGRYVSLGHFRSQLSVEPAGTATVFAYLGHTGLRIAILSRFARGETVDYQAQVFTLDESVASVELDVFAMSNARTRSLSRRFAELHPDGATLYNAFVGTNW